MLASRIFDQRRGKGELISAWSSFVASSASKMHKPNTCFLVQTEPSGRRNAHNLQIITVISSLFLPAEVAHQFQYAVRVIGSNYAPTIERDEFLVSEKIKKECKWLLDKSTVGPVG